MSKYLFFLVPITFLALTAARGQNSNWVWGEYGAGGKGEATATATDPDGNVIIAGYSQVGDIIFGADTVPHSDGTGVFLVKYDGNGNVLWAKGADGIYSDQAWDVTADNEGNIYVIGDFGSPHIVFDTDTLFKTTGSRDSFVVKYDPSGNVLWALSSEVMGGDAANSITTDNDNNVYITGVFNSFTMTWGALTVTNANPTAEDEVYVGKIDASGVPLWLKTFGGSGTDVSLGIATDASNNVYVTGFSNSPSIPFASDTLHNLFVVKYDPLGNEIWGRSYGATANDRGNSIAADAAGNTYLTGYFSSPAIEFGSYAFTNHGDKDAFLIKSSPDGDVIWARHGKGSGEDLAWSVSAGAPDDIFMYGGFGYWEPDTLFFDTTALYPPAGSLDPLYLVNFDTSGNIRCAATLPTGGILASGIASDAAGNVFISGGANATPLIIAGDTLNGTVSPYVFAAKWRCKAEAGIASLPNSTAPGIYPNPFSVQTTLETVPLHNATLTVYNAFGQLVRQQERLSGEQVVFLRGTLPGGLYFMRLTEGNKLITQGKLVITDN